jgi:hypothetical protein
LALFIFWEYYSLILAVGSELLFLKIQTWVSKSCPISRVPVADSWGFLVELAISGEMKL